MTFDSSNLEYCPLLLQDSNRGRYYDSFTEVPRKSVKYDVREVATARTLKDGWEQMNSLYPYVNHSGYLEADDGSTVTESSQSLDSTQSSTPNNEEEISYCAVRLLQLRYI